MADMKETKEAIVAVAALLKEIKVLGADGFQFSDITAFIDKLNTDQVFAAKLSAGFDGINKVSDEISNMGLFDGIGLIRLLPDLFK